MVQAKRTRATLASFRMQETSVERVYETYAMRFLERLRNEASFFSAKPLSKLTAADVAGAREKIINSGRYQTVLQEVSLECQSALKHLMGSGQKFVAGTPELLSLGPKEITARIMLTSDRILASQATKSPASMQSWEKMLTELKSVMQRSPESRKKYADILRSEESFQEHVGKAFKESGDVAEFVSKVLNHDSVAVKRGHMATRDGAVQVGDKVVPYVEEYVGTVEFRLLGDSGAKNTTLMKGKMLAVWDTCIHMKALPKEMMAKLGVTVDAAEKAFSERFPRILSELGGAEALIAKVKPGPRQAVPFAGTLVRRPPPSPVPGAPPALERLLEEAAARARRLPKGASAAALLMMSSVVVYSLMQEKQKAGVGSTVPKKVK